MYILSVCITDSMPTQSEPSLDTDPGSLVWISVRITPTLYPGVYWAGFVKKEMHKIFLMKLVFLFRKTCLEFIMKYGMRKVFNKYMYNQQ